MGFRKSGETIYIIHSVSTYVDSQLHSYDDLLVVKLFVDNRSDLFLKIKQGDVDLRFDRQQIGENPIKYEAAQTHLRSFEDSFWGTDGQFETGLQIFIQSSSHLFLAMLLGIGCGLKTICRSLEITHLTMAPSSPLKSLTAFFTSLLEMHLRR